MHGTGKGGRGSGAALRPQSFASVVRHYYKRKMSAFLSVKVGKDIDGRNVTIGFTSYGNKHLFSDATGHRSRTLQRGDLLDLPKLLERSVYVGSAPLSKGRKDNIARFHYFKATLHGNTVYLNVAEDYNNGNKIRRRYLYSVTDKIK